MELFPGKTRNDIFVLEGLSSAAFLVLFSGYLMAPLIPSLAKEFAVPDARMGWIVPAYMIPYGIAALIFGPVSDHLGRRRVFLTLLAIAGLITIAMSQAWSAEALIAFRILSGVAAAGLIPVALAVIGDRYPYNKMGCPMGWVFGSIAAGMAFGSTFGAMLNPIIGWRNEFVIIGILHFVVFGFFAKHYRPPALPENREPIREIFKGYLSLLKTSRGRQVFSFIFANGLFHGGIFASLGHYFFLRYNLGDAGIGRAILGYGIPGIFLGPILGKLADNFGRRLIIPIGIVFASLCAFALVPEQPLWLVTFSVTALSIGFDMTNPLMAGIVNDLDQKRRGQAIGLNSFTLSVGAGLGSLAFQTLDLYGLTAALLTFGIVQLILGLVAFRAFRMETSMGASVVG